MLKCAGFRSSDANIIHAVSTRALRCDYALAARRLVSQAIIVSEQAPISKEVVKEVDNVVQVLNKVGQVAAVVVAAPSRTTSEPASAVRARPAARPTVAFRWCQSLHWGRNCCRCLYLGERLTWLRLTGGDAH